MQFVVPASKVFNGSVGLEISIEKAIVINRYFENQFEEDLYRFCQQHINTQNGRHPGFDLALEQFALAHSIEFDEDITFECLKKTEYRFRKKMEINKTAVVPSIYSPQLSVFG